jgi:hypothetical protein
MDALATFRERFGRSQILWQTRHGAYFLGLDEVVPIKIVTALDDGRDFDAIERETGIRFYSEERAAGRREMFDDLGIDRLIPTVQQEVLAGLEQASRHTWSAVSPYPSQTLVEFAAGVGLRCCCLDWDTFWWFSNKANFMAGLEELGLPRLPGRWRRLGGTPYKELAAEFGGRFVAQLILGAAGSGTAIVESESDYMAAAGRFAGSQAWITPYAGSLSFNVNAIATRAGTAVGYPSVQIVGQEALNGRRAGHCGNDFSATAAAPRSVVYSIREQTERIGNWMAARGYRGLFGLDFVMSDSTLEACAVDLNPRWQGSTSLQAQAERRQGRIPLAAVEIAYKLGLMDDHEVIQMSDSFFEPIEGSQVFPKNYPNGYWKAGSELETGIYSPEMKYLRPALRLHQIGSRAEFLITSGIPHRGRPMGPGVTLLRICSLQSAVDPSSGCLHRWVGKLARNFYQSLALEPAE